MISFNELNKEDKYLINMYTTARRFKNAINVEEKIIYNKGTIINKILSIYC